MNHLPSLIKFREDINALRAWAVLAVLLFHFGVPYSSAGFFGVDIFFVISGYLMAAIVFKGLDGGNFSLSRFYLARARRIIPVLLVVVFVLLGLGWFFLPTPFYKPLGEEAVHALFFSSNILYADQAGYFDAAAHQKWLLHTWSLAVEAHFYILFPIILWTIWRIRSSETAIIFALLIIITLSFLWGFWRYQDHASSAFYLLPSRGWELAVGSLTFFIERRVRLNEKIRKALLVLGVILLVLGFILIDQSKPWPSLWTWLPVLGTSLIILANLPNFYLLKSNIAQWLGTRSYSLYLWHWPLVVLLFFIEKQGVWYYIAIAFVISLMLAHLSYQWIEVPTRSFMSKRTLKTEVYVLAALVFILGIGAASINNFAFNNRLPEKVEIAANEALNINPRREECHTPARGSQGSPGCVYGSHEKVGAILIGDSHAVSTVNPLQIAMNEQGRSVKLWSFSACPTLIGVNSYFRKDLCKQSTNWILDQLNDEDPNIPVVLVNSSDYVQWGQKPQIYFDQEYLNTKDAGFIEAYQKSYLKTLCTIAKKRPTYVIRPYPWMNENVPYVLSKNILLNKDYEIKVNKQSHLLKNQLVIETQNKAAELCGISILDPLPYLCDDSYCYGDKEGRPLYYDQHHLSEYGNTLLIDLFKIVGLE